MSTKLSITGETLCVEMIGCHKLWSFKGQISVPISHVDSHPDGWRGGTKLARRHQIDRRTDTGTDQGRHLPH